MMLFAFYRYWQTGAQQLSQSAEDSSRTPFPEPPAMADRQSIYDEKPEAISLSCWARGTNVAGKLELMLGPMRSNKTAELLRRADMRRQYASQYVLVLKPSDDTKGGPGVVESRNPNGHGNMILPFVREIFAELEHSSGFERVRRHLSLGAGRRRVSGD
jgi:hypothetical protein